MNNVEISRGVFANNLVPGLAGLDLDIELGTLPELELILKTDQKRLGLIRRVFPKDQ